MKVALCFIISYKHVLHKEQLWRDWIEPNKDIINVYFHYKNMSLIRSPWIRDHCIPSSYIAETTYYHVVPAYMSLLTYAFHHDMNNKWFCLLTDSCVPIISPETFRELFLSHCYASIMGWRPSYWNIDIHTRANLKYLNAEYHLANDPWFTLSRDHVHKCILFMVKKNDIYKKVCKGGLANESVFAIVLQTFKELNKYTTINQSSTISDWTRMSNATSPHLFKDGSMEDLAFIRGELQKNKYAMFLRKVDPLFPDQLILDLQQTDFGHDYTSIVVYNDKHKYNSRWNVILGLIIGIVGCVYGFYIFHF